MLQSSRSKLGKEGEAAVVQWLENSGYTICACNYRNRYGEIDIIARKNEVIAFVEVKSRKKSYFDLSEVVNKAKQNKIIKTAYSYIALQGTVTFVYRFDVALVKKDDNIFNISYIENAFTSED